MLEKNGVNNAFRDKTLIYIIQIIVRNRSVGSPQYKPNVAIE